MLITQELKLYIFAFQVIGDFTPKFSIRLLNSREGGQKFFEWRGPNFFSFRPCGVDDRPNKKKNIAFWDVSRDLPGKTQNIFW